MVDYTIEKCTTLKSSANDEIVLEKTDIIANDTNLDLIAIFFKANNLTPGVEVSNYRKVISDLAADEDGIHTEKFYMAICIKYEKNDINAIAILINLVSKHNGLNNMLIDYLRRLKVLRITIDRRFNKPVTDDEINKNFLINIAPKLVESEKKSAPIKAVYDGIGGYKQRVY